MGGNIRAVAVARMERSEIRDSCLPPAPDYADASSGLRRLHAVFGSACSTKFVK